MFGPQGPWIALALGSLGPVCLNLPSRICYHAFPHMLSAFWATRSRWSYQSPLGHSSVWSQLDPGRIGLLDCLGTLCLVMSQPIGLWAVWAHRALNCSRFGRPLGPGPFGPVWDLGCLRHGLLEIIGRWIVWASRGLGLGSLGPVFLNLPSRIC